MATISEIGELLEKSNLNLYGKINNQLDEIKQSISVLTKTSDEKINKLSLKIDTIDDKIDKMEKRSEIIIRYIPVTKNEDLVEIFKKICVTLKVSLQYTPLIFRLVSSSKIIKFGSGQTSSRYNTRNKKTDSVVASPPPILVKFVAYWRKKDFFDSYLKHGNLNLTDVCFSTTIRVFICENLTRKNYAILMEAKKLKKTRLNIWCYG